MGQTPSKAPLHPFQGSSHRDAGQTIATATKEQTQSYAQESAQCWIVLFLDIKWLDLWNGALHC